LAIEPNDVHALNYKGAALKSLGNYTGAILYYDKVLAIEPNDENTLFNKGLALYNLGKSTEAILYYDKALAIDPHDVDALNNKALAIDPKNTFALTNKAAILDRLGNNTTTGNLTTSQPTLGQNETTSGNETTTTIVPNGTITRTLPNGATPYDSGYSHGCSDAKISNLSERYINQPGKGPSSHTFSFMHGYYNGYNACSASSPPAQQPSGPTLQQRSITGVQPTNESWRYNAGYLQGVQGAGLKGHHTVEFLQGYVKGTQQYWFNRGVAEGNNELPKSSTNADYIHGYNDATWGIQHKRDSPSLVKIPVHSTDNYRDFYLGMYEGGPQYNEEGSCPPGHTVEYCAGYKLGYEWSSNVMSFSG
jgi:hypothetical protein